MELHTVYYVLCVVSAFNFVQETISAPVGGFLSGLFSGDNGQPKQAPIDINQLLRQYYTVNSEDQLNKFNPFDQINSALAYGQPRYSSSQIDGYAQADPYFQYQNSPYQANQFAGDPYGSLQQYYPLYRGGPGQLANSFDEAASFAQPNDQISKLDTLLPNNAGFQHSSGFGSFGAPAQAETHSSSATQTKEATDAKAAAAASPSLVSHRILDENDSAEKAEPTKPDKQKEETDIEQ